MRLINTRTMQLEWFLDASHAPPFAILSHTWEEEEVTFQDFQAMSKATTAATSKGFWDTWLLSWPFSYWTQQTPPQAVAQMKGYAKIAETCRRAREDSGLQYAWVDTCCIDKTSSAELSEAINSMFQWYQVSEVCYVWLSDMQASAKGLGSLGKCRWFTRGWTLQELIAPLRVEFYDKNWTYVGNKSDLRADLERITGIGSEGLGTTAGHRCSIELLGQIPVARRMSWAANRVTTRAEDMAYCLLGIFGVNMPLLYGEGSNAFIRLQEEIAKDCNDLSLFAWTSLGPPGNSSIRRSGILAASPAEFADARDIDFSDLSSINPEFAMTNKGLRMWSVLCEEDGKMILPLNCRKPDTPAARVLGIYLLQFGPDLYVREHPGLLAENIESNNTAIRTKIITSIFVTKRLDATVQAAVVRGRRGAIRVSDDFYDEDGWSPSMFLPEVLYTKQTRLFLTLNIQSYVASFFMSPTDDAKKGCCKNLQWASFIVILGMDGGDPWVRICTMQSESGPEAMSSFGDLKKLAHIAKTRGSETATLLNDQQKPELEVTVKLTPYDIDGQPGYLLSLSQQWLRYLPGIGRLPR